MPSRLPLIVLVLGTAAARAAGPDPRISEQTFASAALRENKTFAVVAPPSPPGPGGWPVLFLLHGRGRSRRSLIDLEAARRELLAAPFCLVLPDGDDGWYINSPAPGGPRYGDYLDEVIREAGLRLPISHDRRRRAIAGWSMGGYGAVSFAEAHPEEFGAVVGIIGVIDFPRLPNLPPGQNYTVPVALFGTDSVVWKKFNPIEHVSSLRGLPVLLITARGSFDRTMNERFLQRARAEGVGCQLVELEGAHTLATVVSALPRMRRFVESAIAQ